jgi:tetratricopeptide (TPR) repeat protein
MPRDLNKMFGAREIIILVGLCAVLTLVVLALPIDAKPEIITLGSYNLSFDLGEDDYNITIKAPYRHFISSDIVAGVTQYEIEIKGDNFLSDDVDTKYADISIMESDTKDFPVNVTAMVMSTASERSYGLVGRKALVDDKIGVLISGEYPYPMHYFGYSPDSEKDAVLGKVTPAWAGNLTGTIHAAKRSRSAESTILDDAIAWAKKSPSDEYMSTPRSEDEESLGGIFQNDSGIYIVKLYRDGSIFCDKIGQDTHIRVTENDLPVSVVYNLREGVRSNWIKIPSTPKPSISTPSQSNQAVDGGATAKDWFGKGSAFLIQGKLDEAVKAFEEAIRLDPNDAGSWLDKGVALSRQGKYDEARKAYEEAINASDEAIRQNPNLTYAWYNKGNALKAQGKYDEAIKAYDKAIEGAPLSAAAWNNKGLALQLLGRTTEANEALAKAEELGYNG